MSEQRRESGRVESETVQEEWDPETKDRDLMNQDEVGELVGAAVKRGAVTSKSTFPCVSLQFMAPFRPAVALTASWRVSQAHETQIT